ncbi:MAG: DUF998 domain-containing protein [Promethearchaeota archaeon]
MPDIKKFFMGNISRKAILTILPAMIAIPGLFLTIAFVLFPGTSEVPYKWTSSTISRLGWPIDNPDGWIFFNLAMISFGIFLIPAISYLHRKILPTGKLHAYLVTFFFSMAAAGILLLGIIPNFPQLFIFHAIDAVLAFLGMLAGCITLAFPVVLNRKLFKKRHVIEYVILLIYATISLAMAAILAAIQHGGYYVPDPNTPILLSTPFWEWQLLFLLLALLILAFIIIPEHIEVK